MLTFSVHDTTSGRLIAQICVALDGVVGTLPPVPASDPQSKDANVAQIAGRIEAPVHPFHSAIKEWGDYLRSLGKRDSSIYSFAAVIRAAVLQQAWRDPNDATWKAVTDYMGAKRQSEAWKGTTYNRNMSAFRSFSRWWAESHGVPDPLKGVRRADDDSGDGSRASTIEEARAIITQARLRQGDARCRGNRALYWYTLFAAGCRHDEPARWRWKHLHLDTVTPFIDWTREIHKSKKHLPTGIGLRLAEMLRAHRHTVPHGPDDAVFPIVPPRQTFRSDRVAAGILEKDDRGRPFSPHSFRKGFSTVLTGVGVPEKMCDRLMRHSGRVEHRYYDPHLTEQVSAASQMPELWALTSPAQENLDESSKKAVAGVGGKPYISSSDLERTMASDTHNNSVRMAGAPFDSGRTVVDSQGLLAAPAFPADLAGISSSANGYFRTGNPEHNRPLPVRSEPVSLIVRVLAQMPAPDRRQLIKDLAAMFTALAIAWGAWSVWHFTHTQPERPIVDVPSRRVP